MLTMEATVQDKVNSIRLETLRIYANRFARLLLLRRICLDDHPVLMIERELVEMARSKLMEHLLSVMKSDEIGPVQPLVEQAIRKMIHERIAATDSEVVSTDTRNAILVSLATEDLELFRVFHLWKSDWPRLSGESSWPSPTRPRRRTTGD